jgi:hypothetical protein
VLSPKKSMNADIDVAQPLLEMFDLSSPLGKLQTGVSMRCRLQKPMNVDAISKLRSFSM